MTAILGISAFYHDSAAVLIVDGKIGAAAQEERFTRKKHNAEFPAQAVDYCLQQGQLRPSELDYVGFYDKPFLKFERLLETYLGFAPQGFGSFLQAMPVWLKQKLPLRRELNRGLKQQYGKRAIKAQVEGPDGRLEEREVVLDHTDTSKVMEKLFAEEKVVTIHSEEATLEDIFISVTGRGLA